ILHQPGAVELAATKIAGERGQPTAAQQAAGIAHRIFAMHTLAVAQRRTGDDDRAKQVRPQRGEHHHGPPRLTIADHTWLAVGLRVEFHNPFKEYPFRARHVLDCLSGHWLRQEADEVARMTRL